MAVVPSNKTTGAHRCSFFRHRSSYIQHTSIADAMFSKLMYASWVAHLNLCGGSIAKRTLESLLFCICIWVAVICICHLWSPRTICHLSSVICICIRFICFFVTIRMPTLRKLGCHVNSTHLGRDVSSYGLRQLSGQNWLAWYLLYPNNGHGDRSWNSKPFCKTLASSCTRRRKLRPSQPLHLAK